MNPHEDLKRTSTPRQTAPPGTGRRSGRKRLVVVAEEMMTEERPVWLTREEAAKRYNISLRTLDKLSREPGFPVYRQGRLVRFSQTAVDEWIATWRAPEPKINPPILGLSRDRRRPRS